MGAIAAPLLIAGSLLGAGVSYVGQRAQEKQAEKARRSAEKSARAQQKAAEESVNRANAKAPNIGAALDASLTGGSSTLLTGPQGVDPNALPLGKSTLLGG